MKPDIVMQWCVFCDYPLYRAWATKYRDKFNKIIIYPSRHHGKIDLEEFARKVFPETWITGHTIDWTTPGIDWRQAETEPCLEKVESDWIYFSEQDFFCKDWDKFFKDIEGASKYSDVIGLWNATHFPYVHPSCFLMKRELFEKTNKDFRAHPEINGADHFSMLTRDAEKLGAKITTLQDLGYNCEMTPDADAFHLGGLTYVYQDWKGDGTDHFGVKSPEAFAVYNYWMSKAPVEQSPEFINLSLEVGKRLQEMFPNLGLENNSWIPFFKA